MGEAPAYLLVLYHFTIIKSYKKKLLHAGSKRLNLCKKIIHKTFNRIDF